MSTQVLTMSNGVHTNGKAAGPKAKSKNQYKRLKVKSKRFAGGSPRESSVVRCCSQSETRRESQSSQHSHLKPTNGYESAISEMGETDDEGEDSTVEYVTEALDVQPGLEAFSDVFARFQLPSESDAVRLVLRILSCVWEFCY